MQSFREEQLRAKQTRLVENSGERAPQPAARLNADRLPKQFFTGVQMNISASKVGNLRSKKPNELQESSIEHSAPTDPNHNTRSFSGMGADMIHDVMGAAGVAGINSLNKGVTLIQNG